MPAQAFYCSLCKVFSGDSACAEEHMKADIHNERYRVRICHIKMAIEF